MRYAVVHNTMSHNHNIEGTITLFIPNPFLFTGEPVDKPYDWSDALTEPESHIDECEICGKPQAPLTDHCYSCHAQLMNELMTMEENEH